MSTLLIITLSLVGAVLFVVGGFLIARSTQRPPEVDAGKPSEEQLRELAQRERAASVRVIELEQRAAAEHAALTVAQESARRFQSELSAAESAAARGAQEVSRLSQALAEAEHALRASSTTKKIEAPRSVESPKLEEVRRALDRTTREHAAAQTRVKQLEHDLASSQTRSKQLEHDVAGAARRVKQLENELSTAAASTRSLEEERSRLAIALGEAKELARALTRDLEQATKALAQAREQGDELSLDRALNQERTKSALSRISEMEGELTSLRADSIDRESLTQRLVEATNENQRLRAQVFAMQKVDKVPRTMSSVPPPDSQAPLSSMHGDVLQHLVERIAEIKDVRSVALTDGLGFVVASTGEHTDELAAFGAYLANAGSRAETLLPFDHASEVLVRDRNGVVLATRALEPDLALVTLGVGEAPTHEVTRIITTVHPPTNP